jgi:hypothetical protein
MFESGDTLLLVGVTFHHVVEGFFLSLIAPFRYASFRNERKESAEMKT